MNPRIRTLLENLQELKPTKNELYIVHTSLWLAAPVKADLPKLFNNLIKILGKNSTLCFPSFTFKNNEKIKPVWYRVNTRGETGILNEYVRKELDSIRTIHPTHSFAIFGKYSKDFANKTGETAFGTDSTLKSLVDSGAKNISFGSGFIGGHSFLHVAEELQQVLYRSYIDIETPCILEDGSVYEGKFRYFGRNKCSNGKYHENDWVSAWSDFQERQLIDFIDSKFGMVALSDCNKVLNYMKQKIETNSYSYAGECEHKQN